MAAANGGNVEGAVAGEAVVTANGVTIIGYTDLAGRLPAQASQLYGTNLVNLMKLMTPGKDGQLVLDFDDVVQRSMTVVRDGRARPGRRRRCRSPPLPPPRRGCGRAGRVAGQAAGLRRRGGSRWSGVAARAVVPARRRCHRRRCWGT